MAAGRQERTARACSIGRPTSVSTMASAYSRPSIPGGAESKGFSLSSWVWGAWSVATASRVPSIRPARTASTSDCSRSGGFTLNTASKAATSASVRVRWCGATSAVARTPSALARRMSSTEPAVLMCWKCTRAPVRRASARSRATMSSSAAAGMPGMPRRLDQAPSCMWPPSARASTSQCWARTTSWASPVAYSMARRIRRSSCTPLPSSVKRRTPRSASSAIGVSCLARPAHGQCRGGVDGAQGIAAEGLDLADHGRRCRWPVSCWAWPPRQ